MTSDSQDFMSHPKDGPIFISQCKCHNTGALVSTQTTGWGHITTSYTSNPVSWLL